MVAFFCILFCDDVTVLIVIISSGRRCPREWRPLQSQLYILSQNGDGQGMFIHTHTPSDRTHSDFIKEFMFVQCRGTPADATTGPSRRWTNNPRIIYRAAWQNACTALWSPHRGVPIRRAARPGRCPLCAGNRQRFIAACTPFTGTRY